MNTDVADARSRAKSLRAHCRLFSPSPLKDRSGSRGASFENIGYPGTLKRNPVYPRKQLSTVLGRQRPIRRKRSRLGVQTSISRLLLGQEVCFRGRRIGVTSLRVTRTHVSIQFRAPGGTLPDRFVDLTTRFTFCIRHV